VGFPIRKSTDQRVFAPPRSLSQRITSFIACACQGIHQLPLRHLIVLIANAHLRDLKEIVASAKSCAGLSLDVIGTKRPASRDRFEGAVRQTHHMQEIERLLRQITNLSAHEVRTNLLFTMSKQNKRQTRRPPQTFLRMTFLTISSTPFFQEEVVEPDGIEPTTSCLQSRRSPS
jgi:hypothetical protein